MGFSGNWVIENAAYLACQLTIIQPVWGEVDHVVFYCSGIERLDTSGAWLIHRRSMELQRSGFATDVQGFKEAHFKIVKEIAAADGTGTYGNESGGRFGPLEWLGRRTIGIGAHVYDVLTYYGRITSLLMNGVGRPGRLRFSSVVRHMHRAGINAAPIVALLAFLISIVLTYQGATQLREFGAEIYTVNLISVPVLREMAVVLTRQLHKF